MWVIGEGFAANNGYAVGATGVVSCHSRFRGNDELARGGLRDGLGPGPSGHTLVCSAHRQDPHGCCRCEHTLLQSKLNGLLQAPTFLPRFSFCTMNYHDHQPVRHSSARSVLDAPERCAKRSGLPGNHSNYMKNNDSFPGTVSAQLWFRSVIESEVKEGGFNTSVINRRLSVNATS